MLAVNLMQLLWFTTTTNCTLALTLQNFLMLAYLVLTENTTKENNTTETPPVFQM